MNFIPAIQDHIKGRYELTHRLFVLAPYKAGSTMLFNLCEDICALHGIKRVSYPDVIWGHGGDVVDLCYEPIEAEVVYADSIVYLGNRQPINSLPLSILSEASALLMVRDPRDCLVSMYFSFLGSHTAPGYLKDCEKKAWVESQHALQNDIRIDDYVLEKAPGYLRNLEAMLAFAFKAKDYTVIKYEDYILDKVSLCWRIHDILAGLKRQRASSRWNLAFLEICRFPGWRAAAIKRIASKLDVIPTTERPDQHVRRALPGDHRNKLSTSTIGRLNDIFGSILTAYSYHVPSAIDR